MKRQIGIIWTVGQRGRVQLEQIEERNGVYIKGVR